MAFFLIARQVVESEGHSLERSDVHRQVRDYFKHSTNSKYKRVGKTLDDLRRERNAADYDLETEFDDVRANKIHNRAKTAFTYLSSLLGS